MIDRYNGCEPSDSENEPGRHKPFEDFMKKLTAKQVQEKGALIRSMESVADEITAAVKQVNIAIAATREEVESLTNRYNEIAREASAFMESVHDEQDNFFSERSTGWQEGDAGQSYESWMDEWSSDLEEVDEVELPEEVEEPEFDAVTILRDLPEQP